MFRGGAWWEVIKLVYWRLLPLEGIKVVSQDPG
jgi:hypothetical protein